MASSLIATVTSAASSDAGGGSDDLPCWAEEVEKLKSEHNCEETLLSMCRSYGIPEEDYRPFCAPDGWGPCAPPPEGSNALCVFEGMLQAGVRFPLHEFYNKVLRHYNLAPSQLTPNSWRYLAGFVLLCDGDDVGVRPMLAVFRYYFKLFAQGGKLQGWYHFVPRSQNRHLFKSDGRLPFNDGWKKRFFFLESRSAGMPWRCPQKWGTPNMGAYRDPVLAGAARTAINKLEANKKEKRDISLMEIVYKSQYQDTLSVLPTLQAPVKVEASDDGAAASTTPSPLKRKHESLCAVTPPVQLAAATPPSPPGFPPLTPSSTNGCELSSRALMVCQLMQNTETELHRVKEELVVEKARHADEVTQLKNELAAAGADIAQLTKKIEVEKGTHMADVAQLRNELETAKAEHTADVAQLSEKLRAEKAEQATKVARLTKDLHAAKAEHAAKVLQLGKELQAERAERAAEVKAVKAECQLKVINAEHTSGAMLSERYAAGLRNMRDLVIILYPDVDPARLTPEALTDGSGPPGFPPRQAPTDQ